MKKILFINPFGIGDVLFTTPCISALKNALPQCVIGYWCNERVREVLAENPHIDRIFSFSRGDLKRIADESGSKALKLLMQLFFQIKKEKFDVAIDFSLDHRYGFFSFVAGIKKRIGFDYRGRGRFLTEKLALKSYHEKHMVEYYLDLLRFFDITPHAPKLELYLSQQNKARGRALLTRKGAQETDQLVGLVCGAGESWGRDASLKQWPVLRFAQLADRVVEELGGKIVLLGSDSERPLADIVINAMKHKPIDLVGSTSLVDLAAILQDMRLVVTNDGGPLHMAVALGVKSVSLFGPVDEKVYGPYPPDNGHAVLKAQLDCRPCYRNFRMPLCERDRECLKSISVDEVFREVKRLW